MGRIAARVFAALSGIIARERLLGLLIVAVLAGVSMEGGGALLEEARLRGFDLEQRLLPRQGAESPPVVVVAIDDDSLARYGQWPWPRTRVAQLIERIGAGQPLAVGVDIIFPEPDRFSPDKLAESDPDIPSSVAHELAGLPSHDDILAAALRAAPAVLGIGVADEPSPGAKRLFRATPIRQVGGDVQRFLPGYAAMVRSLPVLTAAEHGRAALVGQPDRDGIVRRVPLFVVAAGHLVADLALETLRVAMHEGSLVAMASPAGMVGGTVDGVFLPTDRHGLIYPYFGRDDTEYLSAADVLDPTFDPARLRGDIVLLGVTGLGLVDVRQTPLGLMHGIDVHAALLRSILTGQVLRRPVAMARIETGMVAVGGLLVVFVLPYRRAWIAAAGLLAIVASMVGAELVSFWSSHLLLDGIYPSFAAIATFGAMLGARVRADQAEIQAAEAALQEARMRQARLDGELSAARSIQMGLLPRRFPTFAETRSVDVHALIESARMVGGDLYDFMMIDPQRLFFAIADVSGKGVPAALFMAMTKQVLHDATLHHGNALDAVFSEANQKITASAEDAMGEGADPMFVTVFAGILDLASGALAYVSAGHDSPYVLREASAPKRLETAGGPPLGTLDDYPYPVDKAQLQPGDVLLLCTDGVTEAKNVDNALYGTDRLSRLASLMPARNAKSTVERVREDLRQFVASADQADDITLLAVRWLGSEPS